MSRTSEKITPINFKNLEEITQELQSGLKRYSETYKRFILGITKSLDGVGRGSMTKIEVDELRDQIGYLLYYHIKDIDHPIPFDIEYVPPLKSHIRNPTVIVLRRIRRYLMASHRKILAKLEEEQARERRLQFEGLNINAQIKRGLEEMQRFQTLGNLAKTVTRKLDILTKALHVPAHISGNFKMIRRLLDDQHHLRRPEAMRWLESSSYAGNLRLLNGYMDKGLGMLNDKSKEIFSEMERLSGIPFDQDTSGLDTNFNWYSLGTPLKRGEDFVRIFENEERIDHKIKRLTFFMVRSAWDAEHFRELKDSYQPNPRELQENCTKLARLYMEIEEKIIESTRSGGEVQTAIQTDLDSKALTEKEVEEAGQWVQSNKVKLQALKLEIFEQLSKIKKDHKDVAMPENLEEMISEMEGSNDDPSRSLTPKVNIFDLHREMEVLEEQMAHPDGQLLADLITIHQKIKERKEKIDSVEFQQRLRNASNGFEDYEEKLLELQKSEDRLEEMRTNCEEAILECYREIEYADVDRDILKRAFQIVIDKMLQGIKTLDYDVIDCARFREFFNQALKLSDQNALFHLDWLLHEVHVIPRQDQLINALADWESSIGKQAYENKQEFILENELELQKLVDDVRAELRERIPNAQIKPRRLRFEVFSLSDCYAGNLRTLLDALLRMAPVVASESEGERLISNIQAIESQIIESQRITKPKGEAYEKLKEMERLNLFPPEVIQELNLDLKDNFQELDTLLKDTNQGLERVRLLQNRFGGSHDTNHLSITINIHDLESLKSIYHFVDNITIMDMKRFGVVYKQKYSLMEDLFEKAKAKDPNVPESLIKGISGKVYKQFAQKRHVPLSLKITIYKEIPEILDFDAQLLIRTLNFVSNTEIRNKAAYRGILKVLETVNTANISEKRTLRRVWVKFRSAILAYKPKNYKMNYQNNSRALMTDSSNIIGSKFEDL